VTGTPGADSTPDPLASATPSVTPLPRPGADPAIVKSASTTLVSVGDTVEFTLSVTNLGSSPAADVVIEDSLPAFLALDGVSATRGDVSVSGATVRVLVGTLEPGETVTVRITVRVVAPAVAPNNVNVGTVATTSEGDDPSNNVSRVELNSPAQPAAPPPARPATLPVTADGGAPARPVAPFLLLLGLAMIAASILIRTRRA